MPLHKNKIFVSSIVYAVSVIVIAAIFGMWHNLQLETGYNNYLVFILLLVLALSLLSWFYIILFNEYRKQLAQNVSNQIVVDVEQELTEIIKPDESITESFDLNAFINGIIPENKISVPEFGESLLQNLAEKLNLVQGLFYAKLNGADNFEAVASYAYYSDETPPPFKVGESLPGQAVKDKRVVVIQNIPENYVPVVSGLGSCKPKNLIMVPVFADKEPIGLIEMAVFSEIKNGMEPALKELSGIVGKKLNKLMK